MSKKKASKAFINHPESKALAKKFADDIANILVDQFKQSEGKEMDYQGIENQIKMSIASKESEFKEHLEKISEKIKIENQKVIQRNNLVKINIR